MGAPIGDRDFEEAFYEAKATAVVSKIIDTAEMLHDRSAAAAHTLLYTCLQHQWGYRMRTCRGAESIVSATARVDEALKRGLLLYSPRPLLNDELLARADVKAALALQPRGAAAVPASPGARGSLLLTKEGARVVQGPCPVPGGAVVDGR